MDDLDPWISHLAPDGTPVADPKYARRESLEARRKKAEDWDWDLLETNWRLACREAGRADVKRMRRVLDRLERQLDQVEAGLDRLQGGGPANAER